MNEQFSRLYHLAWNYAESDPEYQEKPTYERRCVVQSRIFAELIVRECITKSVEICMNRVQGDCWKNNQADIEALRCSLDIQRELPKHFGVEE